MVEHDRLVAKTGDKCVLHLLGTADSVAYHACTATIGKAVFEETHKHFDLVIDKGHVNANGTARRLGLYASCSVSVRVRDEGICVSTLAWESRSAILALDLHLFNRRGREAPSFKVLANHLFALLGGQRRGKQNYWNAPVAKPLKQYIEVLSHVEVIGVALVDNNDLVRQRQLPERKMLHAQSAHEHLINGANDKVCKHAPFAAKHPIRD